MATEIPALLTEIRTELGEIKESATKLRKSVEGLAEQFKRSRRWTGVLTGVVVVTVLVGTTVVVISWRMYTNLGCIHSWANATTTRSIVGNARIAAEDQLFRDAGAAHPDPAKVKADYRVYLKAAAAYGAVPIPQSYNCRSF